MDTELLLNEFKKQNAEQAAQIAALLKQLEILLNENKILHKKVNFLVHRLFGRKTEKLSPGQLEFLLANLRADEPIPEPPIIDQGQANS